MRLGKLLPFVAFLAALIIFAFAAPVSLAQARAENQPPGFSKFSHTLSVPENTAPGQPIGNPVQATDPDGDSLYYAILNGDAAMFAINSRTGQVRTKAPLDYETKPEDDYWFHVAVRDGKGPDGSADLVGDDFAVVTVVVEDADDPGTLTLDWRRPYVGVQLTATLSDPDVVDSEDSWQWKRSNSRNGSYTEISGATSAAYTPVPGDENKYLQATVSYTNSGHSGRTAEVVAPNAVRSPGPQGSSAPVFSEGTSATRSVGENTPAGTSVGSPVRATGGADLLYTLTRADSFSIDRWTGQIKTTESLDHEDQSSYTVTVTVDAPSGQHATIDVTISVTDEPVEINGPSSVQHSEDPVPSPLSVASYDIVPRGATLTLTGPDARHFSIGHYAGLAFNTQPDYESPGDSGRNNVYEVTINAVAGSYSKSRNVRITVTDYNEAPFITGPENVTFIEETTGTLARYTARDPENDPIRWYVQTTDDHEYFKISRSGVLAFKAPPDADTKDYYELVIVAASGMNQAADGKRISVTLTDVEDPVFSGGNVHTRTVAENTPTGTDIEPPVSASDPGSVTYSLAGPDAGSFALNSSDGKLRTRASLDYETRDSYTVWVRASNGRLTAHAYVAIEVENVAEPGTLTLSSAQPRARVPFTATLTDLDGEVWSESWQWQRSTTQDSGYADIPGANSATYTPADEDVGNYLKATVSYTDIAGKDSAEKSTTRPVGGGANRPPEFPSATDSTMVDENTAPGEYVGYFMATDPDNDTLSYYLGGTHGSSFTIDRSTGGLQTRSALDYEARNTYTVVVTARDPSNASATMTVTINVNDLDEPGGVDLSSSQPRVGTSLTARLTDPDGGVTNQQWQWSRSDTAAGTFSDISGAASASYTPVAGDLGKYLRATVTYDDNGSSVTVSETAANAVLAALPQANLAASYGFSTYTVTEGRTITITVQLSRSPTQNVAIPVTAGGGTAESGDYSLSATSLSFGSGSSSKTFTVTANQDDDTQNETLTLGFGSLPSGVSAGSPSSAVVTIRDDDAVDQQQQQPRSRARRGGGGGYSSYTPSTENRAPVFMEGASATRSVRENSLLGTVVEPPVLAVDANQDSLTYSLSGVDRSYFGIRSGTAHLTAGAVFDYESRDSYAVTVSVTDGRGGWDSIEVTVNVSDVIETVPAAVNPAPEETTAPGPTPAATPAPAPTPTPVPAPTATPEAPPPAATGNTGPPDAGAGSGPEAAITPPVAEVQTAEPEPGSGTIISPRLSFANFSEVPAWLQWTLMVATGLWTVWLRFYSWWREKHPPPPRYRTNAAEIGRDVLVPTG